MPPSEDIWFWVFVFVERRKRVIQITVEPDACDGTSESDVPLPMSQDVPARCELRGHASGNLIGWYCVRTVSSMVIVQRIHDPVSIVVISNVHQNVYSLAVVQDSNWFFSHLMLSSSERRVFRSNIHISAIMSCAAPNCVCSIR